MSDYSNCRIINIRRGSKSRGLDGIVYADLVAANGSLLIAATLSYIQDALRERLPAHPLDAPPLDPLS